MKTAYLQEYSDDFKATSKITIHIISFNQERSIHMNSTSICTNIFKNGDPAPASDAFTKVWINLINQMEKSKAILGGSQN